MSLDDWLLALHLLSAFALVGALTVFSIGLVALRGADTPGRVLALGPTMQLGQRAVIVGVAGTVVFGVWLAISVDAYQLWDLWIVLALVGWAAATAVGMRSGALLMPLFERAEQLAAEGNDGPDEEFGSGSPALRQAHLLHWVSTAITLLVLVDMIWKPGA
jgi:hypothetical protein